MSLTIQYCFFCGLPIIKSKGRGPDNMIEHHISYIPEFKVKAHSYCHGYYHTTLHIRGRREDALFPEYIKNRFLTRLSTGRGDGYIPYEKRVRHLKPFDDILLRRHIEQHIEHYIETRYMADAMGIKELPR